MEFAYEIAALARRVGEQRSSVETEEATKNAFVMPFLRALGYDVFDPRVVVPEFTADVGVKKGEKVDYAIRIDGKVVMLIECKACKAELSESHFDQLYRYFSVTDARFAILTNGIIYWMFTELDEKNKMDSKPFFVFDITSYQPRQVEELKKFSINHFDVNAIMATASDLKYNSMLMREIGGELDSPSEELMRLFIGRVHDGKVTANVLTKFGPLVQAAIKDTVTELVNKRLIGAIVDTKQLSTGTQLDPPKSDGQIPPPGDGPVEPPSPEVSEAYQIVRAIVRELVSPSRVSLRGMKAGYAVLLDDSNRKPICRLYLGTDSRAIGLISVGETKTEERIDIKTLDDIFAYATRLKATTDGYEKIKTAKKPD